MSSSTGTRRLILIAVRLGVSGCLRAGLFDTSNVDSKLFYYFFASFARSVPRTYTLYFLIIIMYISDDQFNERPKIIIRSSFPVANKHSGHGGA